MTTYEVSYYYDIIDNEYNKGKSQNHDIYTIMNSIIKQVPVHDFNVEQKVMISSYVLEKINYEERKFLAKRLLEEQVVEQRKKLNNWSAITAQSSQIDTGYIAQHLVSLQTQIAGQGMRGKGDDLRDGSEVKSANYLDSLDKKGAKEPRWNFSAGTERIMERFLEYPSVYLLSMDLNKHKRVRTRIWKVDVTKHEVLKARYTEWMEKKGYPKFKANKKKSVNFQLFPPHSKTEETFARHGNGRANGFSRIQIALEDPSCAKLIFRADESEDGQIFISVF